MTVFYMSFVQHDRPKGDRFVGACLIHAESFEDAIKTAWRRGCNPGGEIQGAVPENIPDDKWFNRLLSRADLMDMETELRAKYYPGTQPALAKWSGGDVVCEDCNAKDTDHDHDH